MAQSDSSAPKAVTLDQLVALNEEIAGLVRIGVPLERGLWALGGDMPGRLGRLATTLAEEMDRGESLPDVLRRHPESFPPLYRAVVEAGLRAGRLPIALEGLAGVAGRLADARRLVAYAAWYPLLILLVAWGLFMLLVCRVLPELLRFFESFEVPGRRLLAVMVGWGVRAEYWGPAVPIVVVVLALAWWLGTSRTALLNPGWARLMLGWVPWTGKMVRWLQAATFADVLAMLVENRVRLDEAVVLAAGAASDPGLSRAAKVIAAAVARGDPMHNSPSAKAAVLPPLVRWLMSVSRSEGTLLPALRHAAVTYRRRARYQIDMLRIMLPVGLTLLVGGSVTLSFALMVFGPWAWIIKTISGV